MENALICQQRIRGVSAGITTWLKVMGHEEAKVTIIADVATQEYMIRIRGAPQSLLPKIEALKMVKGMDCSINMTE